MNKLYIEKIISGGQTGADRAALDFAIDHSIPHGGACPKGRFAEDGVLPGKYQLYEVGTEVDELNKNYPMRTIENITQSDGTLIVVPIYTNPKGSSDGTFLTINKARELNKPFFIFQIEQPNIDSVIEWLQVNQIKTLNVAGPRQSTFPGIYQATYDLLDKVYLNTHG